MVVGSSPVTVKQISDNAPTPCKFFLDIQAIAECRFTLNMYVTYSIYNHFMMS